MSAIVTKIRRELQKLNASEVIITATKNPDISCLSNKIQIERSEQLENEGINYPDHFSLELVKERLDEYDVFNEAIFSGQLKNPGKPGAKWFNTFLKKDEFLSKTGKPLVSKYLRKLGAVYAVVSHDVKNLSKAKTIASEALRHNPNNHVSSAKKYTIVNLRKRGQPYDQAMAFKLFDEN
ncbi:hypothetical protein C1645_812680 [Glomus cerebriforme]|uniref:Uncharacterized protein n=1 Tax=Glomus cerebriforme TaxID=658196 RepID=A0A397TJN2_9GLOM|nr:hypothetical protein C1645_812680 [Glomus cerebriforme]